MSEEQIFLAALDQPDAATRAKYLDEACQGNTSLREQVGRLLAAHFQSGEFLDVPAPEQVQIETSAGDAVTILTTGLPAHSEAAAMNQDDDSSDLEFLAPASRPDSLGRIGHYEVLQVIGKGGFGTVLRAFDDVLQRVVAIKVMAPVLAATSPARKRFTREAQSSAQVRHENVVQVYEVGEQPLPYLVMEFIPGETLQQRLDRIGPLDVPEVVRIGRQIAEGLAAAHATDLIHRDIKPGNVLLEGGHLKVKITDFGLARAGDDASMTQSGMIAGTPMYMAPEQVLGQMLDQRADLFSLGTVMYQMAAGRVPFRAPNSVAVLKRVADDTPRPIREVIPETPQWLCDIISKLHAKNPAERYQSAREVADVLADCEAQLKQNSRLRDYSRIPRAANASPGSALWKWVAVAAVVLFFSAIGLAQLEFAGITRLFGGRQPVGVVAPPAIPISDANFGPSADGFVPLFNGKDLTGWQTNPGTEGSWTVTDGVLKGRGLQQNYLYSETARFRDFHLRAEARINGAGNSGIHFRAAMPEAQRVGAPPGYEVQIAGPPADVNRTGSLMIFPSKNYLLVHVADPPAPADKWFTLEIIAEGRRIIVKVDGKTLANTEHTGPVEGRLALQVFDANTVVQFRKIEIKELPASPPATGGFVALFNGKDLTGWKKHALSGGEWKVEDGAIDGRGITSYLFTESSDYANYHLRVEAKINANGDAGVYIRTPFDVRALPISGPAKFTLLAGYEAAIALRANYPTHTGSLTAADGSTLSAGPLLPHKPDEWFVLEVIAEDNHIRTLVDGKPAADYIDDKRRASRGHIALQTWGPGITSVQFRKVEIKTLPTKPESRILASASPLPPTYKNSLGMEFVIVPKGKSWLGGGKDQPGEQEVEIPADFYLGKYEVTQEDWQQVMGENPSRFSRTGAGKDAVKDILDADLKRFPVENVSWDQCQNFVAKLNSLEKETGWVYRLPKEAEWEYACRGGPLSDKLDSAFDFYFAKPTNTLFPELANFNKGLNRPCQVGSYEANHLGLFDMHGNVWEWCGETEKAVVGVSPRVYLGGSYTDYLEDTRTALRRTRIGPRVAELALKTSYRYMNLGLRLALVPSGAPSPEATTPPPTVAKQEPPPLAVAPFDAAQAKNHQDGWAKHLAVPVEYTNSIGMKFRLIPPGEFQMGASEAEIERILDGVTLNWQISRMKAEGPQQAMTVREPYYLGQHEVTLGQFRQFVQEVGYKTTAETNGKGGERNLVEPERKIEVSPDYIWSNPIDSPTDDHPVVFVSIEDARQFCLWLCKKDGRSYALPRDDQWEFACRGGTTTRWSDEKDVQRIAWVRENSEGRLHPIGQKAANPFGLCDMHGNAAELCEPVPPKKAARRGGDSTSSVVSCRSASRWEVGDALPWFRQGFRVAIVSDLKPTMKTPTPVADVLKDAALPAAEQVEEVRKELMRRNPGFDGQVTHKIDGDVVTEIRFLTDQVTDIAPIRVWSALRVLDLYATHTNTYTYKGNGQLADLSPLAGMNLAGLTRLNLSYTRVGDAGLVHFKDCTNLTYLNLDSTQVSDAGLAYFKNCGNLDQLLLGRTKINDAGLSHFKNCKKLTLLDLSEVSVGDAELGYFKECEHLTRLGLGRTLITDAGLVHFKNCKKLQHVNLLETKVSNVGLALLRDCKELTGLFIGSTKVTDLSLIKDLPLKELDFDFRPQRDAEILRSIKTLEKINGKPAAEFWKEFE